MLRGSPFFSGRHRPGRVREAYSEWAPSPWKGQGSARNVALRGSPVLRGSHHFAGLSLSGREPLSYRYIE